MLAVLAVLPIGRLRRLHDVGQLERLGPLVGVRLRGHGRRRGVAHVGGLVGLVAGAVRGVAAEGALEVC